MTLLYLSNQPPSGLLDILYLSPFTSDPKILGCVKKKKKTMKNKISKTIDKFQKCTIPCNSLTYPFLFSSLPFSTKAAPIYSSHVCTGNTNCQLNSTFLSLPAHHALSTLHVHSAWSKSDRTLLAFNIYIIYPLDTLKSNTVWQHLNIHWIDWRKHEKQSFSGGILQ